MGPTTFRPGLHYTNVFSIAIQIIHFTLTSILIQRSLQHFVYYTAAVLSWHVQKFVVIQWAINWITARRPVRRIWITGKNPLLERANRVGDKCSFCISPRGHLTKYSSITIHVWLKFHFVMNRPFQTFAHDTTEKLHYSTAVVACASICWNIINNSQTIFPSHWKRNGKIDCEMGLRGPFYEWLCTLHINLVSSNAVARYDIASIFLVQLKA